MPGFLGGNKAGAAAGGVPPGMNIKDALIQAAPLFASMAAGYSSGRGPYAYMDQGVAGIQANQKAKRDEEAAAAAAAAFGGVMRPGGNGVAGGYGGSAAPPVPIDPNSPGILSADTMKALGKGPVLPAAPEGWDAIKNGIFAGESGGDYNALYGYSNRPGGKYENVKLVDMTVDQALQFADPSGEYGQGVKSQIGRVATPMGAYQIVGTTLKAAKEGLGLTGSERMTPELQDALGQWIYGQQGTGAWEGYRGPIEGGAAPAGPVDPMSDPYVQQLMTVMSMPGLTPEQQAVIQMQLQSRIQTITTPPAGAEEEAARAMRARDADTLGYTRGSPEWNQYVITGEQPAAATPVELKTFTGPDGTVYSFNPVTNETKPLTGSEAAPKPMTADERAAWGIPATDVTPYALVDGLPKAISGGAGTTVNIDNGGGKFEEAFAKGDADTIATVYNSGLAAQRNLSRIDQLASLLAETPTGFGAAMAQKAGEWGIPTEGLDEIQAAQALINSLVPEQRQPGSGPMSDADLALFKQSLPQIMTQPGGNKIIVDTMRAVAEYDAEGARIVQQLRNGDITRSQAFDKLQNRPNPLAGVKGGPGTTPPTGNTTASGVTWSVSP